MRPSKHKMAVFVQVSKLIPGSLVSSLARRHGGGGQAEPRQFDPWSHVVSLIYAQLSHALSLNDICDSLWNPRR